MALFSSVLVHADINRTVQWPTYQPIHPWHTHTHRALLLAKQQWFMAKGKVMAGLALHWPC